MTAPIEPRHKRDWRGALLPLVLILSWWIASAAIHGPTLLPSPGEVARAAVRLLGEGVLLRALLVSLARDLTGLIIGATLGVAIGTLVGMNRIAAHLVTPTMHAIKLVSPFAWIPLLMAWFGLGEASKVAFIALVAFLPVAFNTMDALAATPRELIELGRVHRFSHTQFVLHLALPSAMPGILNGLYLAIVAAWMATLGAEYMLTSGGGVGAELVIARDLFATADLIVYVLLVGLIGVLFHRAFALAEREILIWRPAPSDNPAEKAP